MGGQYKKGTTDIWSDQRGGLWWEGQYKKGTTDIWSDQRGGL